MTRHRDATGRHASICHSIDKEGSMPKASQPAEAIGVSIKGDSAVGGRVGLNWDQKGSEKWLVFGVFFLCFEK